MDDLSDRVIEFLLKLSGDYNTVFLKGNHEEMFLNYLDGNDRYNMFLHNGGSATIRSYKKNCGNMKIPSAHLDFFKKLNLYYEYSDFISVHAGFNPKIYNIEDQSEDDMLWIREAFYRADRKWDKTVIFGHTPTTFMGNRSTRVFSDKEKNIIGIDTGAVYGGKLTCLSWPEGRVFQY